MSALAVMLIENVTTSGRQKISTTQLPIAKRVDFYTCFTSLRLKIFDYPHNELHYKTRTISDFKYCSTDSDCKDIKIYGVNAGFVFGEYPLCSRRQAGVNTSIEEPAICCNKWALYENYTTLGVGLRLKKLAPNHSR